MMDCIAVFGSFFGIYFKEDNAIIGSEMLGISFYLGNKIIHDSFGVSYFVHRELETDGAILFKHLRKVGAHLIIGYVVTNNNH